VIEIDPEIAALASDAEPGEPLGGLVEAKSPRVAPSGADRATEGERRLGG